MAGRRHSLRNIIQNGLTERREHWAVKDGKGAWVADTKIKKGSFIRMGRGSSTTQHCRRRAPQC